MTARTAQTARLLAAAVADLHAGHPFHILPATTGRSGAGPAGPSHPGPAAKSRPSSTRPAPTPSARGGTA